MYHVGQRVVCIADPNEWDGKEYVTRYNLVMPKKNAVYTIRSVKGALIAGSGAGPYLRFSELINPIMTVGNVSGEPQFHASMFRPLDEKRIDVFRKLLVPIKSKVS